MDHDFSLLDGFEFVSPIMQLKDINQIDALTAILSSVDARPSIRTGIHVHLSAQGMSLMNLLKMMHISFNIEPLIYNMFNIDKDRLTQWCQPMNWADDALPSQCFGKQGFPKLVQKYSQTLHESIVGSTSFQQICKEDPFSKFVDHRFRGINLLNLCNDPVTGNPSDKQTIEFRYFNTDLEPGIAKNCVLFMLHMHHTAMQENNWEWMDMAYVNQSQSMHEAADKVLQRIAFPVQDNKHFVDWLHKNIERNMLAFVALRLQKPKQATQYLPDYMNQPLSAPFSAYPLLAPFPNNLFTP